MKHIPVPIAFPSRPPLSPGSRLLAADIGGTKTELALFEVEPDALTLLHTQRYVSQDWPSLTDIVRDFGLEPPLPQRMAIAFAGPIIDGVAQATNLDWMIDVEQLPAELGIPTIDVINDLEAGAYGLASLTEKDVLAIYPGIEPLTGNAAIVAPGTGLGEAGLYWDGQCFHPFATEGGHSDFAPRTELDWQLLWYLHQQFGHVSWERVVSGQGIVNIYNFLRDVMKREVPPRLHERAGQEDTAAVISEGARNGIPICVETLDLFARYLATESANVVLKFKATGGLFIGGGIPPKIWNDRLQGIFLEHFFGVGRLRPLVEEVPVRVVLQPQLVLLGAAYYAASGKKEVEREAENEEIVGRQMGE